MQNRARNGGSMVALLSLFQGSSFSLAVRDKSKCSLASWIFNNNSALFLILPSYILQFLSPGHNQEMKLFIATCSQATSHRLNSQNPATARSWDHIMLRYIHKYAKCVRNCTSNFTTIVPFHTGTEYSWAHGNQNHNYISLSQRTVGIPGQQDMS